MTVRITKVWQTLITTGAIAAFTMATPALATTDSAWCPYGYVCVQPAFGGPTELIREGDSREFSPPLNSVEVTNNTRLNYCVTANPSFPLGPGQQAVPASNVVAVGPGGVCPLQSPIAS